MKTRSEFPIAVFDSGIGGLSVFRAISKLLPAENMVYLADNKRVPYGDKSPESILEYTWESASFLQSLGIKMLVIACHTSSAHCLEILQKKLTIPVVGVIQSGLKSIMDLPNCRKVGVLGTKGTIASGIYPSLIQGWNSQVEVFPVAAPGLVPLIEKGLFHTPELERTIARYTSEFLVNKVDAVLLACTHYPLIRPLIQRCVGDEVLLIEASEGTALEVKECLHREGIQRKSSAVDHRFYVTDALEAFTQSARLFLNIEINAKLR